MSDNSPAISLPYMAPAQAQKHVTYNEALSRLDVLVQLTVAAFDALTPPAVPIEGETYALGTGAQDAWAGQDGALATYTAGGWVFVAPRSGWIATEAGTGMLRIYRDDAWTPPETAVRLDNLDWIGINTTADATNRLSVTAPATLLNHTGAGHQLKINKATDTDTASLLYQSNWSGRAEMGLAGDDDFSIKVSNDGNGWNTGLKIAQDTGHATMAQLSSGKIIIEEDSVGLITTPGSGGFILLCMVEENYPQSYHSGILVYDTGPSQMLVGLALGPNLMSLGTTTLTGTTGSPGTTSVSAGASVLQVENRFGSSRTYSYTFLGGF